METLESEFFNDSIVDNEVSKGVEVANILSRAEQLL